MLPEIGPGHILRLREIRNYGQDPRTWISYRPDNERSAARKQVFVAVLVGTEPYQLADDKGTLDVKAALNEMGWFNEDQLKKAGVSKRAMAKLAKGK